MLRLHINISRAVTAVAVVAALTASSCKKFIEIQPDPTSLAPSQIFADSIDATSAITGIYISMIGTSSAILSIGCDGMGVWTGMAADEFDAPSNFTAKEFFTNTVSITNAFNNTYLWANAYKYIYQANACIEGVTASTGISDAMKSRFIGEAKFLRAFYHFAMMNMYGPVPLCVVTDYKTTSLLPRADTATLYKQIVADLEEAAQSLQNDPVPTNVARPNRYAAKALLARVYLYRQQWAAAEAAATEVIGGNYGLVNNLDSVFLVKNREAIWQVPSTSPGAETVLGTNIVPSSAFAFPGVVFTTPLLNAFESGDKRRTQWVTTATVSGNTYTYPYKFKLRNVVSTTAVSNPREAYTPLRLSEMYLIRAEARLKLHEAGATDDLNKIRNRAGLVNTTASSDDDVMKAIMQERRIELFGEWGHRFFDLKRTGAIDAVMSVVKPAWKTTYALLPIPYNETQLNPNLTPNP